MVTPLKKILGIALGLLLLVSTDLLFLSKPVPIKLGLVVGLTGRVADLGIDCRNGAMLAVEAWNRKVGTKGRAVELLIKDDQQDENLVRRGVSELLDAQVDAIIGPVTSAMSVATIPLVNAAQVVMLSPTTTTDDLQGIDDYFLRCISPTRVYAGNIARYLHQKRGLNRMAIIYDQHNEAYSSSYYRNFRQSFEAEGGEITVVLPFRSGFKGSFLALARQVATPETEGVLIIANSMDAASFCQQLRKVAPDLVLASSEWAATAQLIEIGGVATEGLIFGQFFDRNDPSAEYQAFRNAFTARFHDEPGFGAVTSYDAVNMVLVGMTQRLEEQSLKETLLAISTFQGVQGPITLDRFGDAERASYLFTIRNGHFTGVQ